ncbi:uncharacterized protein EV420DRAFT_1277752 [Desarmillaria tabescens]|uniref:Signal recognition particle subunit SRP72 n=1 Tax=Armillaria tabescens TaxID=1929756 RepID=A0AA39MR14_ARMTA|nr:uncharacterized protein EV420DRAFT_1277752 [Desarmillaria tabescens]KAK0443896.1 hypothetical protein EV420DRAFT_1277752 [Desarmillaria tabescens]
MAPRIKPKAATKKAPLLLESRLQRLFTSLCAQIDGGHFVNALKTCDKILTLAPDDPDALQTKLFLLLQTERYDAALDLPGCDGFEKAYALYRMQKGDEAREVLKEVTGDAERGAMHLEAQLNYRNGEFATAVDLYTALLDSADPASEEHTDILTNLSAAQLHLDFLLQDTASFSQLLPPSIASSLESGPPPAIASSSIASTVHVSTTQPIPTTKKVRTSRVPKGITPGVSPAPDPERWLKKSERSTYQQSKKKGRGGGGGGATQGLTEPATGGGGGSSNNGGGAGKKKGKKK